MTNECVHDTCQKRSTEPGILLRRLIFGHRITQLLATAAELNIADHLTNERPRSAEELSSVLSTHPLMLYRLLRALASVGVVSEEVDGGFILTQVGECLRNGTPGSMRSWLLCEASEYFHSAWANLTYAIRTGGVAFEQAHGKSFYQYLSEHKEVAEVFNSAMVEGTALTVDAVIGAFDFSGAPRVVDVGGGYGFLLIRILQAFPQAQGVLFDVPTVLATARERMARADVGNRCTLVEGDFFRSVPSGGDIYILSRILMDYDDSSATRILNACRDAMAPGGRILVIQQLLAPSPIASACGLSFDSLLSDVNMIVLEGGQERSETQYRDLFRRARLVVTRIIPTSTTVSIIEGVPSNRR